MDVSQAICAFLLAIDGEVAGSTATWYARRLATLERVLGPQELAGVTIDDLRQWRASLLAQGARWENHAHRPARAGKLSPHTMHANLRAVKRLFHWCLAEGHISHDPTARLRLAVVILCVATEARLTKKQGRECGLPTILCIHVVTR